MQHSLKITPLLGALLAHPTPAKNLCQETGAGLTSWLGAGATMGGGRNCEGLYGVFLWSPSEVYLRLVWGTLRPISGVNMGAGGGEGAHCILRDTDSSTICCTAGGARSRRATCGLWERAHKITCLRSQPLSPLSARYPLHIPKYRAAQTLTDQPQTLLERPSRPQLHLHAHHLHAHFKALQGDLSAGQSLLWQGEGATGG